MIEDHPLSQPVQDLCARFELVDGRPQLGRHAFHRAVADMRKLPASEREFVLAELVALALKFQEMGGAATHRAVAQLLLLGGNILLDLAAAERLFESRGVDLDDAAKLLGRSVSRQPAPRARPTDAQSLLSLRAGKDEEGAEDEEDGG